MSEPHPVGLRNSGINPRPPSAWTSKKLAIGLLIILIVLAMIAWFGFLGWGALEMLRAAGSFIRNL